jgi:hypothetical protein
VSRSGTARAKVLAVGAVAGPLLLAASTLSDSDTTGGTLQMYAMVGVLLAAVGITQLCESLRPRFAAVATFVSAIGVMGGIAYGLNGVYIGAGAEDLNAAETTAAHLSLHLPGPVLALMFIVLGALLLASRVGPTWSGAALIVGGLLFPPTRIGDLGMLKLVPDTLFLVGLLPVAVLLWRARP